MSSIFRPVVWRFLFGAVIAWNLCIAPVLAQDGSSEHVASSTSISARYPARSIQSADMADRALADAASERSAVEARFVDEEHRCYSLFFANTCREAARERRRLALAQIRPVEVEANAFKRHMRVLERDKALADKRAEEEQNLSQRQQAQQKQPEREPSNAQSAKRVDSGRDKIDGTQRRAQHEARLGRLEAEEAANAQKRADNISAYEKKVRESEARQREVEARKIEKERERAHK
jgi:colicin import membrane protein